MAAFCHFFKIGPAEAKAMTLLEYEAFQKFRSDTIKKHNDAQKGSRRKR